MQKNIELNKISIEPFSEDILNRVAEIEQNVFKNPWSAEMYRAEMNKTYSHHYVAKYHGEVVGFFGFFSVDENIGEVTNIAVDVPFQGQGIGKLLVKILLDKLVAFNMNELFLETRATNVRAQKLYESFGFKLINIRKKYYDGEEDAYIYRWQGR